VAVLAVVAYHAGVGRVEGGFVGVDVFYVLSGFLITGLLWEELQDTGRLRMGAFYARRRRSSRLGKNDPARSLGMRSSKSPAVVDSTRGRCPLRCPSRVSVRWCGAAPITAVSSASMRAW
jgi:hypothetical protein